MFEKLEQTLTGVNFQLDLEVKANQKLMDGGFLDYFFFVCFSFLFLFLLTLLFAEQRSLIQEITQVKIRMAETVKERSDIAAKLRKRESELSQVTFELSEVTTTKKALAEQLKGVREDLDQEQAVSVKQEGTKKRLMKDLDEARTQLLLGGDERLAALTRQVQDREKELVSLREEVQVNTGAQLEVEVKRRKEVESQLEKVQSQYGQDLVLKTRLDSELLASQTLSEELSVQLEKKRQEEATLDQQVNKERMARLDMEVQISGLRSESVEALKKIDSLQTINLDLMVDVEDLRKRMERDVMDMAKLQKDLKQALQDRIALQERYNEMGTAAGSPSVATGLHPSTSISRKPSMRTNWQGGRNEKKTMEDMRSLQQALDVTIKSKAQLETTNQELLVEKDSLAVTLEEVRAQNVELLSEIARNKHVIEPKPKAPSVDEDRKPRRDSKIFETRKSAASQKHNLAIYTFAAPTKSNISGAILFGTVRQGLRCEACGFACTFKERDLAPESCGTFHPTPLAESISKGCGHLRVPKPKGIRQGWKRVFAVTEGGQVYVFSAEGDRSGANVEFIIDTTSEFFKVSDVNPEDAIHAKKEIDSMFQVSTSENKDQSKIILANSPAEKAEWIAVLKSLHKNAGEAADSVRPLSFSDFLSLSPLPPSYPPSSPIVL